MPQIPAIDQNICGAWTEVDRSMYNTLPYYFMEAKTQMRARFATWSKILTNSVTWTPGQSSTLKQVAVEPSPLLRQFTSANTLTETPKADVHILRERTATAQLKWQDFFTPHFYFEPSFSTFMRQSIGPNMENLTKQISMFEEQFYRSAIWNWSPYMYIAGIGLVDAPQGETDGKPDGWIQAQLTALAGSGDGTLSFKNIFKALSVFEEEVGGTPYEGTGLPGGENSPLNEKFCLVLSNEAWNSLVDDTWLKENRPLNMNIVNQGFKGEFWSKTVCKVERYPIRIQADNNFVPTYNAPEVTALNPDRDDYGRTYPNPLYSKIANSQFEVAWLVGGSSYSRIKPGSPPADFNKALDGQAMNWSGMPFMTKNFLVPCVDSAGTTYRDTNSFGRYLRIQANLAAGIIGINKFNVMPILFKRKSNLTTIGA
jgi:hypothetical protein